MSPPHPPSQPIRHPSVSSKGGNPFEYRHPTVSENFWGPDGGGLLVGGGGGWEGARGEWRGGGASRGV